jgi:hypothetical protein
MPGEGLLSEGFAIRRERRKESKDRQVRRTDTMLSGLDALADVDEALRDLEGGASLTDQARLILSNSKTSLNRCARRLKVSFSNDPENPVLGPLEEGQTLCHHILQAGEVRSPDLDSLGQIITAYEKAVEHHVTPSRVEPLIKVNWHQLRPSG